MKQLLPYFFLLYLFLSEIGTAQTPVHATVLDATTKEPMSGVSIKVQNSSAAYFTDKRGYFSLKVTPENTFNPILGNFFIEKMMLHSFFNTVYDLVIYSVQGKLVYQKKHINEKHSVDMQHLKYGVYYLKIRASNKNYSFKILLAPNNNYITNSVAGITNKGASVDTLVFSKESYFDRKIPVSSLFQKRNPNIKLLQKAKTTTNYIDELLDRNAFDLLAHQPLKTHLSGIASLKAIYNSRKNVMYYMNSEKYNSHYVFAKEVLDYPHELQQFIKEQYSDNSKRYLFPITINYFKELKLYTFEFFATDGVSCEFIKHIYKQLKQTSFLSEQLYFYTTHKRWEQCEDIPKIGANVLYEGQVYQAMNIAESYGYLRKIEIDAVSDTSLHKNDILLTNGIPIDIPVIAGIVTTEFQTPLSHINVLSHNRGTPNMTLRNAFDNPNLTRLEGELVHFKVATDSYTIEEASLEEAQEFWDRNSPKENIVLEKDTGNFGLVALESASLKDISKIGGKAANFAEILNAFKREKLTAPVPENYFAIPFYYYDAHLKNNGLHTYIDSVINDNRFKKDIEFRKLMLDNIRDTIKDAPLDPNLLAEVMSKITVDKRFTSYRFRSSTNAEDLEGFNGAGLYNSYSGKLDHEKKTPSRAIKKVWASLWNFRAFEERNYFKIDHKSTAMGILVHRSFPDEDANGVAITKNIFNRNRAFVINVQFKEISVVNAESGVIHDQVIVYPFAFDDKKYTLEYTNFSNALPEMNGNVMTDNELYQLADYLTIINTYFYSRVYNCNCDYKEFALDIEFKVDSSVGNRILYIKQARPY